MSQLRIELFFDDEAGNWHYRVPALHINGGGLPSRQDAEHDCLSAIAFALEGNPADYDPSAEALTLDLTVAPAAPPKAPDGSIRPAITAVASGPMGYGN